MMRPFPLPVLAALIVGALTPAAGCGPLRSRTGLGGDLGQPDPEPRYRPSGRLSGSRRLADRCEALLPLIRRTAAHYDVDAGLVVGIVRVESGFNPAARSRVGATGLMQVMPATGRGHRCGALSDPSANLECGVRVLKSFLSHYDGDLTYGLSAYNAGYKIPTRARKARRLPRNFHYVEKVLRARARFLRSGCG